MRADDLEEQDEKQNSSSETDSSLISIENVENFSLFEIAPERDGPLSIIALLIYLIFTKPEIGDSAVVVSNASTIFETAPDPALLALVAIVLAFIAGYRYKTIQDE